MTYSIELIEVDRPLDVISKEAAREKKSRYGHSSSPGIRSGRSHAAVC